MRVTGQGNMERDKQGKDRWRETNTAGIHGERLTGHGDMERD